MLLVAVNVLVIPSTRARPSLSSSVECVNNEDVTAVDDPDEGRSPSKPQRIAEDRCTTSSTSLKTQQEHHQSGKISCWSYWPDSPEARQVFKPASGIGSNTETAKEAVERRIKLLQTVHDDAESWGNVIVGREEEYACSKSEIFEIRQRALFLCDSYQLAYKNERLDMA